jgi:hypothetical protein
MVQLRSGPPRYVSTGRIRPLAKDDLPSISVSRLRATGVIRPDMTAIAVKVGELERTVGLAHTTFPNGGGWSWFVCPQCQHRTRTLRLTEDNRLCCWRCDGLLYACQHHDPAIRIARLKALLYGGQARHKPRWISIDRRRRLELSLRRALLVQRQNALPSD